jgi:flavodoxin I
MKTLVIYDSAFGNTQKVAEAIGAALTDAEVCYVDHVTVEDLGSLDFLIVGSPTQKQNFRDGMRDFLASIPHNGLSGVKVAAFDTRISIDDVQSTVSRFAARVFLHRYAAKPIAAALKAKGGIEVIDPEGFFVLDTEGPLREGELERAAAWAQQITHKVSP